jgi:hypothetical protein
VFWIVPAGVLLLLLPLAFLIWIGKRAYRRTEASLARVEALPTSEARRLALDLLQSGGNWRSRGASGPASAPLPPAVADIRGQFEEVVRGEFWVGRSALSEPARLGGFIKVGGDFEFCELMVRPTGFEVYSSYGQSEPREPPETSPSIWHKILEVAEVEV